MLGQRLRRWPNITPALGQRLVSVGLRPQPPGSPLPLMWDNAAQDKQVEGVLSLLKEVTRGTTWR